MGNAEELAHRFYAELLAATEAYDERLVQRILRKAEKANLPLSLDQEADEPNWEHGYPSVNVDCKLMLGTIVVAEWWREYTGFQGGGGTGWWIGLQASDEPDGVCDLLEYAEIRFDTPSIPEPE